MDCKKHSPLFFKGALKGVSCVAKTLVFCIDALCASDLDYLRSLPHFGAILQRGAVLQAIEPVFPALTYSCHTSILTGTYAGRHGIIHNEKLERGGKRGAAWHSLKEDVRDQTLLDLAQNKGLTTCSLSWPVSGGAAYDYNFPMIIPYNYQGYEPEKWLHGTASANLMERYFHKHGRYLKGPQRSLDLFTMALALDILEDYEQPDLMLVKMCDLDGIRHSYGVKHEKTKEQLRTHDEELGAIIEVLRRKRTLDSTNLIVLGDHGQTDLEDVLFFNNLLRSHGFLETDHAGELKSFEAFCHSARLTAFIEVRDPTDAELVQRVRNFLEALQADPQVQLDYVLDAAQALSSYGLSGPFDFVIESKRPIVFAEETEGTEIWGSEISDYKMVAATHGGSPSRKEITLFFGAGPNLREIEISEPHSMVDLAPTLGAMLGISMEDIDGKPIKEILR